MSASGRRANISSTFPHRSPVTKPIPFRQHNTGRSLPSAGRRSPTLLRDRCTIVVPGFLKFLPAFTEGFQSSTCRCTQPSTFSRIYIIWISYLILGILSRQKRKARGGNHDEYDAFLLLYGRTLINGTFLRKDCGRNFNIFVTFYNFLFTRIRSEIQMILMLRIMILAAALNSFLEFVCIHKQNVNNKAQVGTAYVTSLSCYESRTTCSRDQGSQLFPSA